MSLQEKIHNSVLALAVCHNVTPVSEQQPTLSAAVGDEDEETILYDRTTVQSHSLKYQASSPDEVRIILCNSYLVVCYSYQLSSEQISEIHFNTRCNENQ